MQCIDDFADAKATGRAYVEPDADAYEDIEMPDNTPIGLIICMGTTIPGLALVFYIWWLAVLSFGAVAAVFVTRTFRTAHTHTIPAEKIAAEHRMWLAKVHVAASVTRIYEVSPRNHGLATLDRPDLKGRGMKHLILHPGLNLEPRHGEAHERAEPVVFGFWVFLISDLIIFGLMFATYATISKPVGLADGPAPKEAFDLTSVFIQTMILLVSSLTFGFASLALRHKAGRRRIALWFVVTDLLGLAFFAFELPDLAHMIKIGAVPSRSGCLSAFWGLVPLHGAHVAAGCVWILTMLAQKKALGLVPVATTRLLRLGLFWHFLDLVWIGIFTIVYLAGLT